MWDDGGLGREPAAFNDGFASGAQRERASLCRAWAGSWGNSRARSATPSVARRGLTLPRRKAAGFGHEAR